MWTGGSEIWYLLELSFLGKKESGKNMLTTLFSEINNTQDSRVYNYPRVQGL